MSVWGIVVAAGEGRRFGRPKHTEQLAGKPLWEWSRDCLAEGGAERVIMVGNVPGGVRGGPRRRDSVAAGLAEVPEDVGFVLVHDAARPLATPALARAVIRRLTSGGVEGVIPAVPVRGALKRTMYDQVLETVDRTGLMIAQTPQGFVAPVLREAHQQVEGDAPDDADLVGRHGGRVVVVPGEAANLKITFPGDLAVAEALLR